MVRNSLVNISSGLLCFIPFALLTGPFIPDLFVSIIGIIFLILSVKEKKWHYYKNKYFLFFIIFYLYILIRSSFSANPLLSLESSLFYFRFGLFSLAVWFLLENHKGLLKYFTLSILATFVIALADGIYQNIFGSNIFGIYIPGVTRMTLLLNEKMILGGYLARLFPLVFALLILDFKSNKIKLISFSILIIITDVLVYLTGERTALFLFLFSTTLFIFILSDFRKLRIITLVVSIIFIGLISISNDEIRERNIDHTINQMYQDGEVKLFSPQHQSHYFGALKMFRDYPLFGVGPKLFRYFCNDEKYNIDMYTCSTHPHNTYIQILAETGILGFILLFIPLIFICYQLSRKLINNLVGSRSDISDYQACLLICFLVSLWPFIPTQAFFNNWISIIYFLPVGFYLHSLYSKNK